MILPAIAAAALAFSMPSQELPMSDAALTPAADTPASIGQATMEPDGTIVLRLRATGPDAIGEGLFRYPPNDPQYKQIHDHLPGLKPGDQVPVPPFE